MFIVFFVLARVIANVFTSDPEVISTIVLYLRIAPIGYGLFGVLIIEAAGLIVLHKPLHSAALMVFQLFFCCFLFFYNSQEFLSFVLLSYSYLHY